MSTDLPPLPDPHQAIRDALAAGPSSGPWHLPHLSDERVECNCASTPAKTLADAPAVLNANDKAMWLIGWLECAEFYEARRANVPPPAVTDAPVKYSLTVAAAAVCQHWYGNACVDHVKLDELIGKLDAALKESAP